MLGQTKYYKYYDPIPFMIHQDLEGYFKKEEEKQEIIVSPTFKAWRNILSNKEAALNSFWDLVPPSFIVNSYNHKRWSFDLQTFTVKFNGYDFKLSIYDVESFFNITEWWKVNKIPFVYRLQILEVQLDIKNMRRNRYGWLDEFGSIYYDHE